VADHDDEGDEDGLMYQEGGGIVATVLQLVAAVPLIGDLVVLVVLAAAFGAVLVTYLGLVPLEPRGLR
jgi:hypothetical protein